MLYFIMQEFLKIDTAICKDFHDVISTYEINNDWVKKNTKCGAWYKVGIIIDIISSLLLGA